MMGCIRPDKNLGFPRGFVQLVICGVEVVQHSGLAVERLDDIVPGVDLLDLTVDHAEGGLLGAWKYFWLNLTTTSTSASDTGRISGAISVIWG